MEIYMRQRNDRQGLDKAKITIGIPLLLSIIVVGTVTETLVPQNLSVHGWTALSAV